VETKKLIVKQYLGTGKIARLFNVAPRTVAKWIDNKTLMGTRIPGSKHRRVALVEVIRFAQEYGIDIEVEEKEQPSPEYVPYIQKECPAAQTVGPTSNALDTVIGLIEEHGS